MSDYYEKRDTELSGHKDLGLIHVYYGQGVGKTTRVMGLAFRAAGAGLKVHVVQFMKSGKSSEVDLLNQNPNITYRCPGKHPFIRANEPDEVHFNHAQEALGYAWEAIELKADVLICDEILNTLIFKILKLEKVLELMDGCRGKVELAMTGSDAPPEIIDAADYVTELVQRKHPYYSGTKARKGIEF
ncbi:MAG: cob(I)yrinic acid a,c-diamide adenosyltransferase [Thermodesulfobacteriota bacterium]|nr:cob(I)yrinic acid a,c-diamide adenosyltransferase [Thermodesulfobacteriota bacterium]